MFHEVCLNLVGCKGMMEGFWRVHDDAFDALKLSRNAFCRSLQNMYIKWALCNLFTKLSEYLHMLRKYKYFLPAAEWRSRRHRGRLEEEEMNDFKHNIEETHSPKFYYETRLTFPHRIPKSQLHESKLTDKNYQNIS